MDMKAKTIVPLVVALIVSSFGAYAQQEGVKRVLFILTGKERFELNKIRENLGVPSDVCDSFDLAADYSVYDLIIAGSNKLDYYWKDSKPEDFDNVTDFLRKGGHLILFGDYGGRGCGVLQQHGLHVSGGGGKGIRTTSCTRKVFPAIPKHRRKTAAHFSSIVTKPAKSKIILKKVDKTPAMLTFSPTVGGRITYLTVEPAARGDEWMVVPIVQWGVRGAPLK